LLVYRYCPNCKYLLESSHNYVAIGKPFTLCPKCKTIILLDHVKEWDMLSKWGKVRHLLITVYTILFLGIGGSLLAIVLLSNFSEFSLERDYYLAIIGCILWTTLYGIWHYMGLKKRINESRKRVKNPDYLAILKKLNITINQ
jgi:hypothetical protein